MIFPSAPQVPVFRSPEHWLTAHLLRRQPLVPSPLASSVFPTCILSLSQSPLIPPFQAKGRESGPD